MSRPLDAREPTEAELWAIELEGEVLAAELALLDAEAALLASPTNRAVGRYLRALLDVVDLHDLTDSTAVLVQHKRAAVR